jgi:hypothetical protein
MADNGGQCKGVIISIEYNFLLFYMVIKRCQKYISI